MSLARRLRTENAALFAQALAHPFVQGIGKGSLPREVFARWVAQDWLYLQGYVTALTVAAQKADAPDAARRWRELAHMTCTVEMDIHRGLARGFGLSPEALDRTPPYPATTEYLTVLSHACQSYPRLVATLTPCAVGYAEIAQTLAARGGSPEPDYAAWIASYADPTFQEMAAWFDRELDRCCAPLADAREVEEAYERAATCELAFWQALWQGC